MKLSEQQDGTEDRSHVSVPGPSPYSCTLRQGQPRLQSPYRPWVPSNSSLGLVLNEIEDLHEL